MWLFTKPEPKPEPVEQPSLARLRVHKMLCPMCRKALEDNDLVLRWEKQGKYGLEHGDYYHAACVVIIKMADGSMTKIDRTPMPLAIVSHPSLLISEAEWTQLLEDEMDPCPH